MAGKLIKDWFNRRAEDSFTFRNEERLFNWDEGRSRYSSYFMDDNSDLSEVAKIIGSMFRVMNVKKGVEYTLDPNKKLGAIQIPFNTLKKPVEHVEGKKKPKDEYVDINDPIVDCFYGSCVQNAALQSMQTESEYRKTMLALHGKNPGVKDLFFSILNNERVEKKLGDRFPGYLKLVQKMKDFKYDQKYTPVPDSAPEQQKLMDLIIRMLRYPAHITEDEMNKYADPLKSVERLIKKFGGIPKTSDECNSMARSIASIIEKFDPSEPPPPRPEDEKGEEGGDGAPKPSSGKMPKSALDGLAKQYMEDLLKDKESEDTSDAFTEKFEEFIDDMTSTDDISMDFDKDGDSSGTIPVDFTRMENNKKAYDEVLKEVDVTKASVLRRLFARKNKDYDFAMRSMRSGRLDTNKIAEAKQGVPTIYERIGNIKTDKISVTVLIDESGSMNSGRKIQRAQQAAIFINEVFASVPNVELFIYGHTADLRRNSTNILVYREPGHQGNKYSLGNVRAQSQNRDGHAILAVAKRVRMHTQNAGIMLVISDGAPCAYKYDGQQGIKDTRKKVIEAQKLGFQVIQIAIEEHVDSGEMFDHFIKMTNIKNLPTDMMNYLSRKVDRLVKERITL